MEGTKEDKTVRNSEGERDDTLQWEPDTLGENLTKRSNFSTSSEIPLSGHVRTRFSSWDDSDDETYFNPADSVFQRSQIHSRKSKTSSWSSDANDAKGRFFELSDRAPSEWGGSARSHLGGYENVGSSPERSKDSSARNKYGGIDRRQSPARIRRRTKSSSESSSPVFETKNPTNAWEISETNGSDLQVNNASGSEFPVKDFESDPKFFMDKFFTEMRSKKIQVMDVYVEDSKENDRGIADHLNEKFNAMKAEQRKSEKRCKEFFEMESTDDFFDEKDVSYCRTSRKLSKIIEVEEIKKECDENQIKLKIDENKGSESWSRETPNKAEDDFPLRTAKSRPSSWKNEKILGKNNRSFPESDYRFKKKHSSSLPETPKSLDKCKGNWDNNLSNFWFGKTNTDDIILLTAKNGESNIVPFGQANWSKNGSELYSEWKNDEGSLTDPFERKMEKDKEEAKEKGGYGEEEEEEEEEEKREKEENGKDKESPEKNECFALDLTNVGFETESGSRRSNESFRSENSFDRITSRKNTNRTVIIDRGSPKLTISVSRDSLRSGKTEDAESFKTPINIESTDKENAMKNSVRMRNKAWNSARERIMPTPVDPTPRKGRKMTECGRRAETERIDRIKGNATPPKIAPEKSESRESEADEKNTNGDGSKESKTGTTDSKRQDAAKKMEAVPPDSRTGTSAVYDTDIDSNTPEKSNRSSKRSHSAVKSLNLEDVKLSENRDSRESVGIQSSRFSSTKTTTTARDKYQKSHSARTYSGKKRDSHVLEGDGKVEIGLDRTPEFSGRSDKEDSAGINIGGSQVGPETDRTYIANLSEWEKGTVGIENYSEKFWRGIKHLRGLPVDTNGRRYAANAEDNKEEESLIGESLAKESPKDSIPSVVRNEIKEINNEAVPEAVKNFSYKSDLGKGKWNDLISTFGGDTVPIQKMLQRENESPKLQSSREAKKSADSKEGNENYLFKYEKKLKEPIIFQGNLEFDGSAITTGKKKDNIKLPEHDLGSFTGSSEAGVKSLIKSSEEETIIQTLNSKNVYYLELENSKNFEIGEFGDVGFLDLGKPVLTESEIPRDHGDGNEGETDKWESFNKEIKKERKNKMETERIEEEHNKNENWLKVKTVQKFDRKKSKSYDGISKIITGTESPQKDFREATYFLKKSPKFSPENSFGKEEWTEIGLEKIPDEKPEKDPGNRKSVKESMNLQIFFENKRKERKQVESKENLNNWLVVRNSNSRKTRSKYRKTKQSKSKEKEISHRSNSEDRRELATRRSRNMIPPLKFSSDSGCLQSFYKRVINIFCLTSNSPETT